LGDERAINLTARYDKIAAVEVVYSTGLLQVLLGYPYPYLAKPIPACTGTGIRWVQVQVMGRLHGYMTCHYVMGLTHWIHGIVHKNKIEVVE
jgi:hypothetical protein